MDTTVAGVDVETIEADQTSGTVRTRFDREQTSPSMAVITSLAEAMDADPVELEPLHSAVDTDALDAIGRVRPGTDGDIRVTFTHQGHEVLVSSAGVVSVSHEPEPSAEKTGQDDGL